MTSLKTNKTIESFEKLFIAQRNDNRREGAPLVYATWFDKEDSAFLKRQKTGREWAGVRQWPSTDNTYSERFIDNTPQKGFKFVNYVSRYSTQNKWVEIEDPRGFVLQISVDNVINLLLETTVVNGVVQDDCVWTRYQGINYLVSTKNPNYVPASARKTIKMTDLSPGDIVRRSHDNTMTFVGKFYIGGYKTASETRKETVQGGWGYSRPYQRDREFYRWVSFKEPEAWYVFRHTKKEIEKDMDRHNKAVEQFIAGKSQYDPRTYGGDTMEYDIVKSVKIIAVIGKDDMFGRETSGWGPAKVHDSRTVNSIGWKNRAYGFTTKEQLDAYDFSKNLASVPVPNGYESCWIKE